MILGIPKNSHFYILKSKQEGVISKTPLLANEIAGKRGNVCPDYPWCFV